MQESVTAPTYRLDLQRPDLLEHYLHQNGHLPQEVRITGIGSAGEGNMNCTLRVNTDDGESFILKQSRSYVERYPTIPAPEQRIHYEEDFYGIVRRDELIRSYTPQVLWSDRGNYLLAIQDFGNSSDFSHIYKKGNDVSKKDILSIAKVLSELHYRFNVDTVEERMRQSSKVQISSSTTQRRTNAPTRVGQPLQRTTQSQEDVTMTQSGEVSQRVADIDYFLTGLIYSTTEVAALGANQGMRYFQFQFRLTNAQTNIIMWEKEYLVKRQARFN